MILYRAKSLSAVQENIGGLFGETYEILLAKCKVFQCGTYSDHYE
jgi:hypothetical protein